MHASSAYSTHLIRRKLGMLRPGFEGTRGQWSYDYDMQDYEYTPTRSTAYAFHYRFRANLRRLFLKVNEVG